MGSFAVKRINTEEEKRAFLRLLLRDVEALDFMIAEGNIQPGWLHLGAEQEIALVAPDGQPSAIGPELLEEIGDPHYTTEIARFNLEANLDPFPIDADCLRQTEAQLLELLKLGEEVANRHHCRFLLTGILPTVNTFHLTRDFMTPRKRYYLLSDEMSAQRGRPFEIHITGVDEMMASLDNVLFEGCNTSFQLHLQVPHDTFAEAYNWAQLISGPVLAACANSPMLFGRELWMETRIALFQQSIDTRATTNILRNRHPRVQFGYRWVEQSITELFKDHIARFPLLMANEVDEDPFEKLKQGGAPKLDALCLHNGTVYTWNRPCYGGTGEQAHLRIENRYIPSGPTVEDEMANFAFWLGLMLGQPAEHRHFYRHMPFRVARGNFFRAARSGLHTLFDWFGKDRSASDIIQHELLLMARNGLQRAGLREADIDRHLGIIHDRVASGQNGAQWQVDNFRRLIDVHPSSIALRELTNHMLDYQHSGEPVHAWKPVKVQTTYPAGYSGHTVGDFMHSDLYVVREDESLAFVRAIMDWKSIRHLPVENREGLLVGLVTATNLRALEEGQQDWEDLPVRERMVTQLITARAGMPMLQAAKLMKTYGIGCMPVLSKGHLLGIVTDSDMRRLGLF